MHAVVEYLKIFLDAARSISISTDPTLAEGFGPAAAARSLAWSHHVQLLRGAAARGLQVAPGDALLLKWNIAGEGHTGRPAWLPLFELYLERQTPPTTPLPVTYMQPAQRQPFQMAHCDANEWSALDVLNWKASPTMTQWWASHHALLSIALLRCSRQKIQFRAEARKPLWVGNVTLMAPTAETADVLCGRVGHVDDFRQDCVTSALQRVEEMQLDFYDELGAILFQAMAMRERHPLPHSGAYSTQPVALSQTSAVDAEFRQLPFELWRFAQHGFTTVTASPARHICIIGRDVQLVVSAWLRATMSLAHDYGLPRILLNDSRSNARYWLMDHFLQRALGPRRFISLASPLPHVGSPMEKCDMLHFHYDSEKAGAPTAQETQSASVQLREAQKYMGAACNGVDSLGFRTQGGSCLIFATGQVARHTWRDMASSGLIDALGFPHPGSRSAEASLVGAMADVGSFHLTGR